jgi:hypothetical protein
MLFLTVLLTFPSVYKSAKTLKKKPFLEISEKSVRAFFRKGKVDIEALLRRPSLLELVHTFLVLACINNPFMNIHQNKLTYPPPVKLVHSTFTKRHRFLSTPPPIIIVAHAVLAVLFSEVKMQLTVNPSNIDDFCSRKLKFDCLQPIPTYNLFNFKGVNDVILNYTSSSIAGSRTFT